MKTRKRGAVLLSTAVLALGFGSPALGEDSPVPGSCKVHPTKIVDPGCIPAATSEIREPGRTFPNVTPDVRNVAIWPTSTWDPNTMTFVNGPPHLRFDSWVQNTGKVPLELVADDPNNPTTATQCVSWTAHVCRERQVVGEYVWHQEHGHFHYADFADYQLRRLLPDGSPDYSDDGLLAVSEKVSFCLVDASLIDTLKPAPPFYVSCGPNLQGVSPRWADVYSTGTPGQELSLEGLTDGRYTLVVTLDYANRLHESDDTDNVIEVVVEISGGLTQAAILGRNYP